LVGLDEILYGGVAIEGDTDVIIFNPMVSSILKWLRFIILMWVQYLHHSALLNNGLGLVSIVVFPWLHHIPSLALPNNVLGLVSIADETMETKTCGLLWSKSDI
jgi:hypothetical protein